MKKSLTTLLCALLAACAAAPTSQEKAAVATMSPQAQREMEMLESFLTGTFEMVEQDGSKMAAPVMLRHAPFWTDRPGEHWMYAEYARPGEAKPFRQRIYKFVQGGIVTYRLPGEPSAFVGEWRKERPFAGYSPRDLQEREGCRLIFYRQLESLFAGGTDGNRCPADSPGVAYERSEFYLSSSSIRGWDRGFDAAGGQLNGTVQPSEYRKIATRAQ